MIVERPVGYKTKVQPLKKKAEDKENNNNCATFLTACVDAFIFKACTIKINFSFRISCIPQHL